MSKRRVAVTGLGIVSPLGCDLVKVWQRMVAGQSGVTAIKYFDASHYSSRIAGQVMEFDVDAYIEKKSQRRMDPFCHFGVAAAKMAVANSGLNFSNENLDNVGCIISSGIGGLQIMQEQTRVLATKGPGRLSPFMIPQMISNICAGHVAIEYGLCGPNFAIVSACASGTHGIGESFRMIQHGEVDIMLAGGTDACVCELGVGGFCAIRSLSHTRNDDPAKASRPFDAQRDGFVIAEGAAVLVLEELDHAKKRGAHIYCEIAGYGRTDDAYHITAPDVNARGATRSMALAMKDAGVNADEICYINAHGTSTELNDKGETLAIKQALGEENARKVAISSTKSMIGHTLGAAGAMESVVCALTIQHNVIHPTINLDHPDPNCDLDYVPHVAREKKVRCTLNNSLGFGGHNATLCFRTLD
jgi:3-oxoacyl-[acyl-carrier-protein] synthase II